MVLSNNLRTNLLTASAVGIFAAFAIACGSDDPATPIGGTGAVAGGAAGGVATAGITSKAGTGGGVVGPTAGTTTPTAGSAAKAGGGAGAAASTAGKAGGGNAGTAGAAGTAGSAGSGAGTGGDISSLCNCKGNYAMKVEMPLSWESSAVVLEGTGKQVMKLLNTMVIEGSTVKSQTKVCYLYTPKFEGNIGGALRLGDMQVKFPTDIFDKGTVPVATTVTSFADGNLTQTPGEKTAVQVGVNLPNVTDAFPTSATDPGVEDQDGDGKPGVTVVKGDEATMGFACDALGGVGIGCIAQEAYAIMRATQSGFSGVVADCPACDNITGTLTVDNIEQASIGCAISNTQPCTADQSDFIATNQPKFTAAGGGQFTMKRLTQAAPTCADVRAVFP
jgi:hypothetical protein